MTARSTLRSCLTAALLALALPALAQQQLGAIQGTVTDPTGAVIPGVTVRVANLDTGVTRTALSNCSTGAAIG